MAATGRFAYTLCRELLAVAMSHLLAKQNVIAAAKLFQFDMLRVQTRAHAPLSAAYTAQADAPAISC